MARSRKKIDRVKVPLNQFQRYTAARELARMRLTIREPFIRVFDRIARYEHRKMKHRADVRKALRFSAMSPRRQARIRNNLFLRAVLPGPVYRKVHDCKREWSKLLSWRSGQGGGRKRTRRELRNNKRNFQARDC